MGDEQNYHFQVLKLVLAKLGFDWAERIYHLSYGMVELPEGKMKSREGTVVDADDLIEDMYMEAKATSEESGKLDDVDEAEKDKLYHMIGLGALKYFILKVDPRKKMLFNPKESIDFNGNTGPFIQYTHARICSILRKAALCTDSLHASACTAETGTEPLCGDVGRSGAAGDLGAEPPQIAGPLPVAEGASSGRMNWCQMVIVKKRAELISNVAVQARGRSPRRTSNKPATTTITPCPKTDATR